MPGAHETRKLKASAEDVWSVIGEFGDLDRWHPAAVACTAEQQGDTLIRTITVPGGASLVEKLELLHSKQFTMTYSIVEGPLPVASYKSTLKLVPGDEDSCTVDWSGEFDASGVDNETAEEVIRGIYTAGLDALQKRFG